MASKRHRQGCGVTEEAFLIWQAIADDRAAHARTLAPRNTAQATLIMYHPKTSLIGHHSMKVQPNKALP